MPLSLRRWSTRLALAFGAFDAFWAVSALTTQSNAQASTVQMSNLIVWIFLHLPGALLGSLPFGTAPSTAPLPLAELVLIGALGVAQMAGLGWWWGRSIDKGKA